MTGKPKVHGFHRARTVQLKNRILPLKSACQKATQTPQMVVSTIVSRARTIRRRMFAAAISAAAFSAAAHALEHITLTTGFDYKCTHHEPVDATHVRLYFPAAAEGQPEGWQDIDASLIAAVEPLADPPKPAPIVASGSAPIATSVVAPSELKGFIATAGAQRNIDVDLLASIIHNESGFHPKAVSSAGAQGLMQLMPGTARTLGVQDSFNPGQNINGGAAYLDQLLTRYHDDVTLAVAAYNAGPGAVDRYHGVPPYRETRVYVARVLNEFVNRKKTLKKPVESAKAGETSR